MPADKDGEGTIIAVGEEGVQQLFVVLLVPALRDQQAAQTPNPG
jgi:hypothetical protein